ncbi:MAG: hypothetical protein ACFB51_07455 [Anaerolineae bacterium]
MAGVATGCQHTTTAQATLPPGLTFMLEGNAVEYSAASQGCDRIVVQGAVLLPDGARASGIPVHITTEDGDFDETTQTQDDGLFTIVVSDALVQRVYRVQVLDPVSREPVSDITVAESIPDCALNLMTVIFVPEA